MRRPELYSTLELIEHDEAAAAPERDRDATALQLDTSCLAPEVCTHMLVYDKTDYEYRSCPRLRPCRLIEARCVGLTSISRSLWIILLIKLPPSLRSGGFGVS